MFGIFPWGAGHFLFDCWPFCWLTFGNFLTDRWPISHGLLAIFHGVLAICWLMSGNFPMGVWQLPMGCSRGEEGGGQRRGMGWGAEQGKGTIKVRWRILDD